MTIGKGAKLNFCHFPKGNLGRIIIFIIRPLFFSGAAQNNDGPAAMHFSCKSLWCDGHFLEINRAQRTNVKKRQKGMEKPDFAMTILQKKLVMHASKCVVVLCLCMTWDLEIGCTSKGVSAVFLQSKWRKTWDTLKKATVNPMRKPPS